MTNIAHYRKLRGLNQDELGDLVGVKQPHISRIENGDEGPPLRLFREIADALGVTLSDLFADRMDAAELVLIDAFRGAQEKERRMMLALATEAANHPQTADQSATASVPAADRPKSP